MTISRAILLTVATGALVAAGPASAQDDAAQQADAATGEDILVTGERPSHAAVSRQARAVTDIGSDIRDRPLARVADRLCPGVMGLKRYAAEMMVDRIRWNAERLNMWLADDSDCRPNLIVAFVEDGKATMAELVERQPWLFETLTRPERQALLAEDGPVRVWTTAQDRTRDGMPIERRESLTNPPTVSMWMAHSKIYLPIRQDITQTVVLFDRAGVRGKSIVQLADYATMRSFARTRPAQGDAALDTILALFDPNHEPAEQLTDFDQAYLRSVYKEIANLPAAMKLGDVGDELERVAAERAEAAGAGKATDQ